MRDVVVFWYRFFVVFMLVRAVGTAVMPAVFISVRVIAVVLWLAPSWLRALCVASRAMLVLM